MKVKLYTTLAGPDGCHNSGDIIDVDAKTAKSLIDGGYAVSTEPVSEKSEAKPKLEKADAKK